VRFPGDRLRAIRSGKLSVTLRPFEGRGSSYRVGGHFRIERVDDVPTPWEQLEPIAQSRYPGAAAGDVVYVRKATTLEEWVKITHRERAVLDELEDDVVRASGFESLEELVDVFRTDHGGPACQVVWVFDFVYAEGVHLLPGLRAEPEAVDPATLERFVAENRQGDVLRHARRTERYARRTLRERVEDLERLQEGGIDLGRHLARIKDAIAAAEREARRRVA
jgi:hypothetical protein